MTDEEEATIRQAVVLLSDGKSKEAAALLEELVPPPPPYVEYPKYIPRPTPSSPSAYVVARDEDHEKELLAAPLPAETKEAAPSSAPMHPMKPEPPTLVPAADEKKDEKDKVASAPAKPPAPEPVKEKPDADVKKGEDASAKAPVSQGGGVGPR
jgi:hypothetical protein